MSFDEIREKFIEDLNLKIKDKEDYFYITNNQNEIIIKEINFGIEFYYIISDKEIDNIIKKFEGYSFYYSTEKDEEGNYIKIEKRKTIISEKNIKSLFNKLYISLFKQYGKTDEEINEEFKLN